MPHPNHSIFLFFLSQVSAVPPDLFTLRTLTELDLRENPQFVEIPSQIGELVNLEILDLYGCGFKNIPASIGKLSKLRVLDLRNNALSSENLPPQIGRCQALEKLMLAQNVLTSIPLEITEMKLKVKKKKKERKLFFFCSYILVSKIFLRSSILLTMF